MGKKESHYIGPYKVAGNFTYKHKIIIKNINDKYDVNAYEEFRQCRCNMTPRGAGLTAAAVEGRYV